MYLNSSELLEEIMCYIHRFQTVWSVILQKSTFTSPQAIRLLDIKNDTVVNIGCFWLCTVKRNWWCLWSTMIKKTDREVTEWKFCVLQHTLIFMFILFSFVFMYIHVYIYIYVCVCVCVHICIHVFLCVYLHSLFDFVWM